MSEKRGSRPIKLFYSYAHQDEILRKQLETHLQLLHHQGLLSSWHDRKILPGDHWAREIGDNLKRADIILLLISASFLASKYCYDIEMKEALERDRRGKARVIPIILSPCDWSGAPFAKLQALPTNAKPVTTWSKREAAWLDVTQGIRRVIEERARHTGKREIVQVLPVSLAIVLVSLLLSVLLLRYTVFAGKAAPNPTSDPHSGLIYAVKNTDEQAPPGVYFRHSIQGNPAIPTPKPTTNFGVFRGEHVRLSCWFWDKDVFGTHIWYYGSDIERPIVASRVNKGWLSAHYVNDGMPADHPAPGVPHCSNPLPIGG